MARDILLELDDQVIRNLKLKALLNDRSLEEQITAMLNDEILKHDHEQNLSPSDQTNSP